MYSEICSIKKLYSAFKKAKKGKGKKQNIIKFEKNLSEEIRLLRTELLLKSYSPKPLCTFIIRDPKTRKISASAFRDRVVHHALCNVIEPIFDKLFIHDTFANRTNKGTNSALKRFDDFKRKVSRNNARKCYILKADVKQYFENVDHDILLDILKRKINDAEVIWLIKKIIKNYSNNYKGMPLGNLTSQFFANVYLNELDQFIKHKLKVKYYIRYVDDFVALHNSKGTLNQYKTDISEFLRQKLKIELHPHKSKITSLDNGINFLGFRVFYPHKLLRKSNIAKIKNKINSLKKSYDNGNIDYDKVYDSIEGWMAYAEHANTYKFRKKLIEEVKKNFPNEISTKEFNRIIKKIKK